MLHKDGGRIALARHQQSICQLPKHQHLQVRIFTVKQNRSHRVHHYEETCPRSSPSKSSGPRSEMSRPGIEPGPVTLNKKIIQHDAICKLDPD
jgi:hypothetical protein